ncbi:MAG: pyridoxal phosphate-dependent aminotransferase family protein [Bacteroidota bacterium]
MDLFDKIHQDKGPLGKYDHFAYGYYMFPKLSGEIGPHMIFRGKEVLNWSLNNYLDLANHPEVRKADTYFAEKYGMGAPMGARMMSGNTDLHEQLEEELSAFVNKPATMLLNYGYQGIMSVIDALTGRHDAIVYDAESHACIIDGMRLHPGKRFVYPHNDIAGLEKQLQRAEKLTAETGGGILVITEGVFGMSGNQGKLKEIVALKEKYTFRLLVDDAHGFGTMGATGAGTGEHQGCQSGIDLYFSTFAKSMASIGAFVSGERAVISFLLYNTRSQIFAKSIPLPIVGGLLVRLNLLRSKPELLTDLWTITNSLQSGLRAKGFNIGITNSPVTPVIIPGDDTHAIGMVYDLRENFGIFCSIVIYPVIPRGLIILRITPTAGHTQEDIDRTIAAFEAVQKRLNEGAYSNVDVAAIQIPA